MRRRGATPRARPRGSMRLEELSRVLRATDPATVLVAPAVLERVIQKVTGASWVVWRVPHGRCFLVDRATMYKCVEQDELDLPPDHQLPQTVLLLERPSADRLAGPRGELLGRHWGGLPPGPVPPARGGRRA